MPFVLKKNSDSYEWPVTVESPSSGGKFRKDTFKALFKKLSRSEFGALAEQGEDALVTEILDGWKDVKDEEGEEVPFDSDSMAQMLDDPYVLRAVINAYTDFLSGGSTKN